jgi:hypothetical protein
VRDVAFAEDASRIRKNPDIAARLRSFAYNLHRASGCDNIKNARMAPPRSTLISHSLCPDCIEN